LYISEGGLFMTARIDTRSASLTDRVKASLRREGEASAQTIARGLGGVAPSVHGVLKRGVEQGWCRLARRDGQTGIYAFVAKPKPNRDMCVHCEMPECETGPLIEQFDATWACRACAREMGGRS
jgi:hypothetical protein